MLSKKSQKGASGLSLLTIFIVVGFFIMVGFKVLPMYVNNASLNSAMGSLKSVPLVTKKSKSEIRKLLFSRFSVNDIKHVTYKDIIITNKDGRLTLSIAYSVKTPLMGKMSIIVDFDESVEVISN